MTDLEKIMVIGYRQKGKITQAIVEYVCAKLEVERMTEKKFPKPAGPRDKWGRLK